MYKYNCIKIKKSICSKWPACEYHIQTDLYNRFPRLFHDIFLTNTIECNLITNSTDCIYDSLYIYSDLTYKGIAEQNYAHSFYCNLFTMNWLFDLITYTEYYIVHKLNTYAFHASAVYKDGVTTLLLGERGCGKTTIANYLCSEHQYLCIDDDCCLVDDLKIYGTDLPAKIRNPVDYSAYTAITCDGDGVVRGIKPKKTFESTNQKLTNIIFPCYSPKFAKPIISKITFSDFSKNLLINTKHIPDIRTLPSLIKTLYQNCNIFSIKYCDSETVYLLLKNMEGKV